MKDTCFQITASDYKDRKLSNHLAYTTLNITVQDVNDESPKFAGNYLQSIYLALHISPVTRADLGGNLVIYQCLIK